MYDVEWLYSLDKRLTLTRDHRIYDVQTIEHLIDENKLKYSLDSLAKFYLRKSKYEVELGSVCGENSSPSLKKSLLLSADDASVCWS